MQKVPRHVAHARSRGVMRRRRLGRWSFAGALAVTLGTSASGQEPCPSTDWRRVDEGGFSFELPAELARVRERGEDSHVGAFESQSMRVAYDFGYWLLWLGDDLQSPGPHQQSAQIGGHKATIISASHDFDGRNEYRYVRAVQFELPPTKDASRNVFLTLTVRFSNTCDDAVSRRIIESILFDSP